MSINKILSQELGIPYFIIKSATIQKKLVFIKYKKKLLLTLFSIFRDCIALIFFCSKNKFGFVQSKCVDILFDGWAPGCSKFYNPITKKLCHRKCEVFARKSNIKINQEFKVPIIFHSDKAFFECQKIKKIIFCFILKVFFEKKSWNLFKILIFFKLLHEIIRVSSEIEGIKFRILISAHDNSFTPLKYWIYKNKGHGKIILIQNGARVEINQPESNFIFADSLFCWSKKRFFESTGICAKNIYFTGSPLLYQIQKKIIKSRKKISAVFIEQIFHLKKEKEKRKKYFHFLRTFLAVCTLNPKEKFVFLRRPGESDLETQKILKSCDTKNLKILKASTLDWTYNYKVLAKSSICIAFDSSMRWESINLGIPILSGFKNKNDFINKHTPKIMKMNNISIKEFNSKFLKLKNLIKKKQIQKEINKISYHFSPKQKFLESLNRDLQFE